MFSPPRPRNPCETDTHEGESCGFGDAERLIYDYVVEREAWRSIVTYSAQSLCEQPLLQLLCWKPYEITQVRNKAQAAMVSPA